MKFLALVALFLSTCHADVLYREDPDLPPIDGFLSRDNNDPCCDPLSKPGVFGTPICSDGVVCCPSGDWSCGIGNGLFPCGGQNVPDPRGDVCSGNQCMYKLKICADGTRFNNNNDCTFPECPGRCGKICLPGYKRCSEDGSLVNRDPCNNCEFEKCPCEKSCTSDTKHCGNGVRVPRDPCRNCAFQPCPDIPCNQKTCPQNDFRRCPDGSRVDRNPCKNCEFPHCPEIPCSQKTCPSNYYKKCPDGTRVYGDPCKDCDFGPCPNFPCDLNTSCAKDVKSCGVPGIFVTRDPCNQCRFRSCPDLGTPAPTPAPTTAPPTPLPTAAPVDPPTNPPLDNCVNLFSIDLVCKE